MENDVTKKISDLEENKDVAGLEEVKNDAEAMFDGETAGLAEQAIARLNTKVKEITPTVETTEGQKTQVENMGGTEAGLQDVTTPIDAKIAEKDAEIKNVETETEQKITEIKNVNSENQTTEKQEVNNEAPSAIKEIEDFLANRETYGKDLKGYEQLNNFMEKKYPELKQDSPEYEKKRDELVLANSFIAIKKHAYVSEKYPSLSLDEYKKNKPEIFLGVTKYNLTEKTKTNINEIKKSQEENDSTVFLRGKYGHLKMSELTPDFINQNPDLKKDILDTINQPGMDFFNTNNCGSQIKVFLEKGLLLEQDIIGILKGKIQENTDMRRKEDVAGRHKDTHVLDSRNYILGKIPTDLLEKLVKSDESFSFEVEMALRGNEEIANEIVDHAKTDDFAWRNQNNKELVLLDSVSKTLRYKKIMRAYDYEHVSKKYGALINKSLDSMVNDKYDNRLISSALADVRTIPSLIESNVLSKEKILALYDASADKEEKLNSETIESRIKDIKNLLKLGVLDENEAQALSEKYIEKLSL